MEIKEPTNGSLTSINDIGPVGNEFITPAILFIEFLGSEKPSVRIAVDTD
jgi:hypothetical protein